MDMQEAKQKAKLILDEERIAPTIRYEPFRRATDAELLAMVLIDDRGRHPRRVLEKPNFFQFKSTNFDLLCALLDQLDESKKLELLVFVRQRILNSRAFRIP